MYFSFCASYASETILLINLNPCNDGQSTADRLVGITGGRHLVANYFLKKRKKAVRRWRIRALFIVAGCDQRYNHHMMRTRDDWEILVGQCTHTTSCWHFTIQQPYREKALWRLAKTSIQLSAVSSKIHLIGRTTLEWIKRKSFRNIFLGSCNFGQTAPCPIELLAKWQRARKTCDSFVAFSPMK